MFISRCLNQLRTWRFVVNWCALFDWLFIPLTTLGVYFCLKRWVLPVKTAFVVKKLNWNKNQSAAYLTVYLIVIWDLMLRKKKWKKNELLHKDWADITIWNALRKTENTEKQVGKKKTAAADNKKHDQSCKGKPETAVSNITKNLYRAGGRYLNPLWW